MFTIYHIQEGDTLGKISKKFKTNINRLLEINPQIENKNVIYAGKSINIPFEEPDSGRNEMGNSDFPEWYKIALKELEKGVNEIAGAKHNPRILEYHTATTLMATDDETPWCSSFVNWCMKQSGHEGTKSAAARSWLKWGKKIDIPYEGCIVIFERGNNNWQGHVGFYHSKTKTQILTLGGNQKNAVNISSYPKKHLLGYRTIEVS